MNFDPAEVVVISRHPDNKRLVVSAPRLEAGGPRSLLLTC